MTDVSAHASHDFGVGNNTPRAVLFDWDNTLVDNWPVITAALNETFAAMEHPQRWSVEEARVRVVRSLRDSFPPLFGDRWEEARDRFYAAFEARHLDALTPLPGAQALLAQLQEMQVPAALVSNKTGRYLRAEVAHLDWGRYFVAQIGAQDAERDKPDPAPVHLALAGSGIVPGPDVWFVGDTAADMDCARASGCRAVLVWADPNDDGLAPDVAVPDCRALAGLLA